MHVGGHAAAQQEARSCAVIGSGDVEHQRMQENDIPCRARILDDLKRDSVHLFDVIHEARNTGIMLAFSMQVADVGVGPQ